MKASESKTQKSTNEINRALLIALIVLVGVLLVAILVIGTILVVQPKSDNAATGSQEQQQQMQPQQNAGEEVDRGQEIIEKAEKRCGVLADHDGVISVYFAPALDDDKRKQGECLVDMLPDSVYKQFNDDRRSASGNKGVNYEGKETIDGIEYSWWSRANDGPLSLVSNIQYTKVSDSGSGAADSSQSIQQDMSNAKSTDLIANIEKECGKKVIDSNQVIVSHDWNKDDADHALNMACVIDFFPESVRLKYKDDNDRAVQFYKDNGKPLIGGMVYDGYEYDWEIGESDYSDNPTVDYKKISIKKY